ncbi:D-Ala-D-Ala dipeptidase [Simplicispira suum]|uniref:D-Ala-D-Ala dipeptidase n=1 Tax=Simplicispira suum TaxID=2109915 RepID=A0A2S0N0U4_9BURK|nr:D-Ala-D-Ala dipeptidase [Simplicispira suum]AVO41762.1 D-Ala-D-Ala dipeptidase [Simplicispira suum]
MSSTFRFAYASALGVLAAILAAGCIQGPQSFAGALPLGAQSSGCLAASKQQANWLALAADLHAQGLALEVRCARPPADRTVQLLVLDSTRASQVLRGPLADGEHVDMGDAPGAAALAELSPDVLYNRSWLRAALLRHRLEAVSADRRQSEPTPPFVLEIAAH